MNQWSSEQFNMMGAPMPGPPVPGGMVPPLAPPLCMMNEWNGPPSIDPGNGATTFIGPVAPNTEDVDLTNEEGKGDAHDRPSHNPRDRDGRDRRDRDRDRDGQRSRRRSPRDGSRNRDRNERSRSDRRTRTPRWSDNKNDGPMDMAMVVQGNNMMIPGNNMMSYGNTMLGQQPMDMGANMQSMTPNMQNMQNMAPHMQNMPNMMTGMNMMPNMMQNMMPGMMDQNMMMMQQQMPMMGNQGIFTTAGSLLPPIPGSSMPARRDRPLGCRTIFVGGLPPGIGEDVITEIFQRFGGIDDIKLHKQGVCHVRFEKQEMVEASFFMSGYRFKRHDQMDNEATTMFIDYALNRDDQNEFERNKRKREPTPLRIEPYTPAAFTAITDKIKSDSEFAEAAPTLAGWLERGECNKKNANAFYSLIQAANNQIRRLYNEKMQIDEEYQTMKATMKDKFSHVIVQFEQVGKILSAAKHQRASDHFSKQQRRNIEMWLKMTEDVENLRDEFNAIFEDEETEKPSKSSVPLEKYEALKTENDNLMYELEGYKNEAHLAKDEAERKFEKFKAHFIAQQALQNKQPAHHVYPPLPPPPALPDTPAATPKPQPPPPTPDDMETLLHPSVAPSEAKLISVLTAFLLAHPLGASLDYLVSYVKSMIPKATQAAVHNVLEKYKDVFSRTTTGVGANIEHRWTYIIFEGIKKGK